MAGGGHALAGVGAAAADLRTGLHLGSADRLARLRAGAADFGARPAGDAVVLGTTDHEIGARPADLGAVEQGPDVVRIGVLPAHLQAPLRAREANALALGADFDTRLHLVALAGLLPALCPRTRLWSSRVRHRLSPSDRDLLRYANVQRQGGRGLCRPHLESGSTRCDSQGHSGVASAETNAWGQTEVA